MKGQKQCLFLLERSTIQEQQHFHSNIIHKKIKTTNKKERTHEWLEVRSFIRLSQGLGKTNIATFIICMFLNRINN